MAQGLARCDLDRRGGGVKRAMTFIGTNGVAEEMRRRVPETAVGADDWLALMMRWHFEEKTGAPYWVGLRRKLAFDPVSDVRKIGDLAMFGLFDKSVLRQMNVSDLVPRGLSHMPRRVFETGGTSGSPCRIVDVTTGQYNVALYRIILEARDLAGGNVIAMTPSGPHAYGTFVDRLADTWNGNVCHIDFDPRWIKHLIRTGQSPDAYIAHLAQQTIVLLESQRPALLFTTSKLLIALVLSLPRPLASYGVRAVCTGGTSCSREEERYLRENFLEELYWIDTYGNTLMGHALQGDGGRGSAERAYYLPPPQAFITLTDAQDWRRSVGVGRRGRVLLQTLHRDLFLPNLLERDTAIPVGPHPWFPFAGVAEIAPYVDETAAVDHVEGVY
jgi:phenylacetate-coenzyme A ligase PaaK-like adenylate-forming protein